MPAGGTIITVLSPTSADGTVLPSALVIWMPWRPPESPSVTEAMSAALLMTGAVAALPSWTFLPSLICACRVALMAPSTAAFRATICDSVPAWTLAAVISVWHLEQMSGDA